MINSFRQGEDAITYLGIKHFNHRHDVISGTRTPVYNTISYKSII